VLISSGLRWALMHELRGAPEPTMEEAVARLSPCDLVLVEGFKYAPIPKLEVYRPSVGKPMLHPYDKHIVAVASDEPLETPLPVLDLRDAPAIAAFILDQQGLSGGLQG
jgi:molybdopterin-guanine dinucleotide biosynthesis protein B